MKHENGIGQGRRFQRPIVALAMPLMRLRIVQQRWRGRLSWQDFRQQLGIALEQRIDRLMFGRANFDPLRLRVRVVPNGRADLSRDA